MTQKPKNVILFTWISKFIGKKKTTKNPQNILNKQISTSNITVFNKKFQHSVTPFKFTPSWFLVTD